MDRSVDTGEIPDNLEDEQIRELIRDEYLRDSTVTIVLVEPKLAIENTLTGKFTRVCTMEKSTRNLGLLSSSCQTPMESSNCPSRSNRKEWDL